MGFGPSQSQRQLMTSASPCLLAIVEVDETERVYCAQPGCKHTVFKAVHVVRDGDQLLVLGSTCFKKRYGSATALGKAQHWGGNGKLLTTEERALLAENTEALLARFAAEEARLQEEAMLKLKRLQELAARPTAPPAALATLISPRSFAVQQGMAPRRSMPWNWMRPNSSVAAFKLRDGSGWVRVQHKDGRQFVVPWPSFEGWEEALPPVVGRPNIEMGGYEVVGQVVGAVSYLRAQAEAEKVTGLWNDVASLLGAKAS